MEINRRVRINVSTTAKGIFTYDATVELAVNSTPTEMVPDPVVLRALALGESDAIVAELKTRYPITVEKRATLPLSARNVKAQPTGKIGVPSAGHG